MPWVRAKLHGQDVLARADASGRLLVEAGRVEVRYRPNDGRAYRAAARNLVVGSPEALPDETCAAASPAPSRVPSDRDAPANAKAPAFEPSAPHSGARLQAWTDGACSGNPGPAGLGLVLRDGTHLVEVSEYLGRSTNNVAELTAILRAVVRAPADTPMTVHTDSQYSIGVLQGGWKAKANRALVQELKRELARRPLVRIQYTRGHAGDPNNERADALARRAVRSGESSETRAPLPAGDSAPARGRLDRSVPCR
jgi:ribonuclease HI